MKTRTSWIHAHWFVLFSAVGLVQADAFGQSETPSETLNEAVQRFDEGDYAGAKHLLDQLDASRLGDEDRARHTEYAQRASLAVSMQEKSRLDLDAAKLAASEGRADDAERLYERVIDNEYALRSVQEEARLDLRNMRQSAAGGGEAEMSGMGDSSSVEEDVADAGLGEGQIRQLRSLRAKALTRDGFAALADGDHAKARSLFNKALSQVPAFPEAVAGLERLGQHVMVETEGERLIDRIQDRNAIAWQRTVTNYRSAEREAQGHVLNDRYQAARQTLLRGRNIIEQGRQFAVPVSRYEQLVHDADALERYIESEERAFEEKEVSRQRDEARSENLERERRMRDAKRERISGLMDLANQHRKDREYELSKQALQQVLAIDRHNDNARWMLDIIDDRILYDRQKRIREEINLNSQNVLTDVDESKIPWWSDVVYPKNWKEIISRPTRVKPGSEHREGRDSDLHSRLDKPVRIDFHGDPFSEVMTRLADAHETNISVAWNDLAAAGVKRDAPVHLSLSQPVPLRVALKEVLDQVSDSRAELGILPVDGVVKVGTRELLDRNTYEDVYDVADLLMPIPDFDDAPSMDLSDPSTFVMYSDPRMGREDLNSLIRPDELEIREEISRSHANDLIALIRETIDPESWRERGGTVGSITEINGQLVITQTPSGQARIGGLLEKLREQRAIQVALEARFLTVQSNYLEELGMDLDIVLNSGNAGFDFIPGPGGSTVFDPVQGTRLLLPRSFSRLGFTPGTPGVGTAIPSQAGVSPVAQPFTQPGLVPPRSGSFGGSREMTPVPIVNNILEFTDPGTLTTDLPGSFAGNPTLQPAFSLFGSFLDNIQVDFLIRATEADSRTTTMTAPRLVLFNGQRAWVAVVNQQSFVSSLQPVVDGAGAAAPLINNIETGSVLDAQATVSADRRYVTMTLRPSVGRLLGIQTFGFQVGAAAGEGAFVQLPSITRQVVRTTVSVPDGGTLLIGGQKLAGEIEIEGGVPVLSKIPILKRFYSSRTLVKDEQVLLILIKPKIIIRTEAEQEAFPSFSQG